MAERPGLFDRLLREDPGVPLAAGQLPPRKVAWLNPLQLLRTGYQVWLVTAGTGIIDRREVMAALDRSTVPADSSPPGVLTRGSHIDAVLVDPADAERNGLWLDFVADVGDSWEATYAVASMLADPQLRASFPESAAKELPSSFGPAAVVVVGGDLVYPRATRDGYRRRFRAPFTAALPRTTERPVPSLFAIPGNHDWYDGLTNFFREFCQGGFLGGWRLFQTRSYFAVKLTRGWWLWGIDIALDTRIDAPQQAYFLSILQDSVSDGWSANERFERGDRVILCTAKPAWLEISRYSDEAYRNLVFFVESVVNDHGGSVPVILTGDLHHYSRYSSASGCQMIVAGGGGAYLMGTHFLPERIPKLTPRPSLESDARPSASLPVQPEEERSSEFVAGEFSYPNRSDSRRLALQGLLMAFRPANWLFGVVVGALYWFLVRDMRPWKLPVGAALPERTVMNFLTLPKWLWLNPGTINSVLVGVVVALCVGFAVFVNGRASRILTATWGILHGLAHVWLAASVFVFFAPSRMMVYDVLAVIRMSSVGPYLMPNLYVLVAGLAGATFIGFYLVVSDRFFDLHHNDVFAVQSVIDYRNFLRMHIGDDGALEIFPIGLRRVPRRWRRRMDATPTQSFYEPADVELRPHLIEGPIRIEPAAARPKFHGGAR